MKTPHLTPAANELISQTSRKKPLRAALMLGMLYVNMHDRRPSNRTMRKLLTPAQYRAYMEWQALEE